LPRIRKWMQYSISTKTLTQTLANSASAVMCERYVDR
jgi:hypothetical protein